jgi:type I restriction enzyme, R subunit
VLNQTESEKTVPSQLKERPVAKAFFGLILDLLKEKAIEEINIEISTAAGLQIDDIIKNMVIQNGNTIIDWQNKSSILGQLQIEIGDYIIDEVRDQHNLNLSFGDIERLASDCIEVAKKRYL